MSEEKAKETSKEAKDVGKKTKAENEEIFPVLSKETKKKKMILIAAIGSGVFILLLLLILIVTMTRSSHTTQNTQDSGMDTQAKKLDIMIDTAETPLFLGIEPPFTVNIGDTSRLRMMQIKVQLMARNQKILDIAMADMPLIQNALVRLFSSKTYDELSTSEGREALRTESLKEVQEIMKKEIGQPGIEDVLFTSFVMQ